MFKPIPTLLCDFYKISHRKQYPEGTTKVYSNLTPRNTHYYKGNTKNNVIFFGLQYFIKHTLIDLFNENFFNISKDIVISEYARVIKYALGEDNPDTTHIEALHNLGYLPLEIKALPELSLVPTKIPVLTVTNTLPDFYWLTNFIETVMSADLWLMCNNATLAYDYRVVCEEYAEKTCDDNSHVDFQCHDFSMRGMAGQEAAMMSGMAHLQYFKGTDTIQAISGLEYYYGKNIEKELVGTSIPASEHAVMCAGSKETEEETYRRFIEDLYPNGFVSIVSDTWDFFGVLTNILPSLKDKIIKRNGKTVIRPDSGNPVEIICGNKVITLLEDKDLNSQASNCITEEIDKYNLSEGDGVELVVKYKDVFYKVSATVHEECGYMGFHDLELKEYKPTPEQKGAIQLLWEIFGGTINSKGYKVLDSHIGLIYGDSITHERAKEIFKQLEGSGFASSNVVFGIGSYTYQFNTRDSQGWAVKATYCEVNGEGRAIFKDPKTDSGKKSAKGLLHVAKDENNCYILTDDITWEIEKTSELKTVFKDGLVY